MNSNFLIVYLKGFQEMFPRRVKSSGVSQSKMNKLVTGEKIPENILSLTQTSNSLMQKYTHFSRSTFISVDTKPFSSKGIS